ncbi:hypothetical protein SO802_007876 [Lithocarpus litseifolius]|uniref:Uncharacterized protein n=1 Tax=Lithocarpus litseifolius TaxID=425828 RepID=A0AAW2DQ66_9ROSI
MLVYAVKPYEQTIPTAVAVGEYLKEQRLPPQSFIPLQSIRVKPIIERLRAFGGTAKLVFDVIQYPLLKLVSLPVLPTHSDSEISMCAALPIGIHLSGDLYITD